MISCPLSALRCFSSACYRSGHQSYMARQRGTEREQGTQNMPCALDTPLRRNKLGRRRKADNPPHKATKLNLVYIHTSLCSNSCGSSVQRLFQCTGSTRPRTCSRLCVFKNQVPPTQSSHTQAQSHLHITRDPKRICTQDCPSRALPCTQYG